MPKMPPKVANQRHEIVKSFVDNLNTRGLPYIQEWAAGTLPFNPISGNTYRGVNRINLRSIGHLRGTDDPRWLTWRQIQNAGYRVKKGARSAAVEKWKPFAFERALPETGETETRTGIACVGYYNVFNGRDVIGLPAWEVQLEEMPENDVIRIADNLIASSRCPVIEDTEGRAYYRPAEDLIHIPDRGLFLGSVDMRAQHFTRTLAHEMTHSTVVPLQRDASDYAREELVAELGAVMLTTALGLAITLDASDQLWSQHAVYLRSWAQNITDKPQALWAAATQADKATEYLLANYHRQLEGGTIDTACAGA